MKKLVKKAKIQGKTHAHTHSYIKTMIGSLVRSQKLVTTKHRAKLIGAQFDRLVTHAKKGNIKLINDYFNSNVLAKEKFLKVVESQLGDRNSGYTRIVKTLNRPGDNADQAFLMLVNMEEPTKKSNVAKLLEQREKKAPKKPAAKKVTKKVKEDK
jgi:large subunit ribosomal protein L17